MFEEWAIPAIGIAGAAVSVFVIGEYETAKLRGCGSFREWIRVLLTTGRTYGAR